MPKFDVVVGNPPFKGKLYHDFLLKSIEISKDYIIMVHPSMIYLNRQPTNRTNIEKKLVPEINKFLVDIKIFNICKYFNGIGLLAPMAISYFDKNKSINGFKLYDTVKEKEFFYENIIDIHIHGNSELFLNLREKIFKYSNIDNMKAHINLSDNDYYVNISELRGNISLDSTKYAIEDFYTFIPKTYVASNKKGNISFGFNTIEEANNFILYLKSNFARFSLSLYKISMQQSGWELFGVPWLDFTQEWTDEKLYKYFNLTQEEINFIETNIPKYYND